MQAGPLLLPCIEVIASPVPTSLACALMNIEHRLSRARRRAGGRALHGFFHGLATLGRLHPQAAPEKHGITLTEDNPYRETGLDAHKLDVWRPDAAQNAPVVLYVHGGGFRILSKRTHWMMALAFARQGYVVMSIDYRLAPKHPFPAAIEDVCAAYSWVLDHAHEYGGDPSRIVVAGESAGANLVTSLTLATCYRRPEPWAADVFDRGVVPIAAVPACGILDVSNIARFDHLDLPNLIRDRIQEVSRGYLKERPPSVSLDLADPLVFLERQEPPERPLPPFFAPVGTRDPLLEDGRRLEAALTTLGAECAATEYPGEVHAFHAFLWRENARKCWADTFDFLNRHAPVPPDAER